MVAVLPVFGGDTINYARQVHTVFAEKCLVCHSQEQRSGGLSLAAYTDVLDGGRSGAAIRPGSSAASLLVQRITGEVEPPMPLRLPALSAAEIAVIRSWIDEGARATPASAAARPKWEAPLALERPAIPETVWTRWSAPLDRFVSAYLATRNVAEPTEVSDAMFARRAYLDIWGLLPSPGELQADQWLAFEEHVVACPECVAYVKSYEEAVKLGKADFPFLDERMFSREQGESAGDSLRARLQTQELDVIRDASVTFFATLCSHAFSIFK